MVGRRAVRTVRARERVPARALVTMLPGAENRPGADLAGPAPEPADTILLDLLPHPAFAIAVDGDDVFRFIYTNDAYRALRGDDMRVGEMRGDDMHVGPGPLAGDLRSIVPANALVAHVARVRPGRA